MKPSILSSLCVEIYKSINSINPSFMKEIFRLKVTNRAVCNQYRLNLDIPKVNKLALVIRTSNLLDQKFRMVSRLT